MDVAVRVDVCSHGSIQRQAAGRGPAGGTGSAVKMTSVTSSDKTRKNGQIKTKTKQKMDTHIVCSSVAHKTCILNSTVLTILE